MHAERNATKRGRGRPAGATAVRSREAEIGRRLLIYLAETPDGDLRGRVGRYARWLTLPVGERAEEGSSSGGNSDPR